MYFFNVNSISPRTIIQFKNGVTFSLNASQKKVAAVALIALGCLLACYVFYQTCFKKCCQIFIQLYKEWNNQNSDEAKKANLSDEIEDIVKNKSTDKLFLNSQELYNHANIIFKNTSSLKDTRVILIGECHTMPTHTKIIKYIINNFGRDEDIHLVEDCPKDTWRRFNHMNTFGWDDLKLVYREAIWLIKVRDLNERRLQSKELSDNQKPTEKEVHEELDELIRENFICTKGRNLSLITSIKDAIATFPNKKIFVTSGLNHLMSQDYNILKYLPATEKYALIALKDTEDQTMDAVEYAKSLVSGVNIQSLHKAIENL